MRRDIVVWPDNVLKKVSEDFNPETDAQVVQDLLDTFARCGKAAAGLSAIQIGDAKRVFLMANESGLVTVVANPTLVEGVGTKVKMMEGCLSFPGIYEEVERFTEVKVKYDSIATGTKLTVTPVEERLNGLQAHVFQHELEHLNGIVLTEKIREARVKPVTNKLKKWKMVGWIYPPR